LINTLSHMSLRPARSKQGPIKVLLSSCNPKCQQQLSWGFWSSTELGGTLTWMRENGCLCCMGPITIPIYAWCGRNMLPIRKAYACDFFWWWWYGMIFECPLKLKFVQEAYLLVILYDTFEMSVEQKFTHVTSKQLTNLLTEKIVPWCEVIPYLDPS
jgi:hypothetical protein